MNTYKIPYTETSTGVVQVRAESLQEAVAAFENIGPTCGIRVDYKSQTWEVDTEELPDDDRAEIRETVID